MKYNKVMEKQKQQLFEFKKALLPESEAPIWNIW